MKVKIKKSVLKKPVRKKSSAKNSKKKIVKKKAVKKKIVKKKAVKKKIVKKKAVKKKIVKKKAVKKRIIIKKLISKKLEKPHKRGGKVKTGIPNLDKMIRGGFERNSINLVGGGSGSGKSIFALQYLLGGVKKGETVLYITFEEKKQEFYDNMKNLGWDLEKMEKTGKFIFLEYSPEKVKMMLDEGGGTIESIVLQKKVKRLVIDSITSFSLLFDDDLSRRQSNSGLFDIIRKWDCTTLLTVQYNHFDKKDKTLASIEFEVDSIILLYYIVIKNTRERFIEILKMRGTDHSRETHLFDIKKGIKIGKKAKVNLLKVMS